MAAARSLALHVPSPGQRPSRWHPRAVGVGARATGRPCVDQHPLHRYVYPLRCMSPRPPSGVRATHHTPHLTPHRCCSADTNAGQTPAVAVASGSVDQAARRRLPHHCSALIPRARHTRRVVAILPYSRAAAPHSPYVFIYRNLRPYFKFTIPPVEIHQRSVAASPCMLSSLGSSYLLLAVHATRPLRPQGDRGLE